ncbi:hypothetical protein DFH07DRAFT_735626, partial [Mycena maculata]
SAFAGDGGPNVRLAKKLIHALFAWILNIYDPCHNLSLFMKDIGALFKKDVLVLVAGVSNYFSKLNYGTSQLDAARKDLKITQGIKTSSETRFSTSHIQSKAIQTCMPAIHKCIETGTTKKLLPFVSDTPEHYTFMSKLSAFIMLTTAPANTILALEGQYINCAEVFYAWVCMAWSLERLFETVAYLQTYRARVIGLYNARFAQMMSESSYHIFLFAYFMHPSAFCN